jgi:hypothetical protein
MSGGNLPPDGPAPTGEITPVIIKAVTHPDDDYSPWAADVGLDQLQLLVTSSAGLSDSILLCWFPVDDISSVSIELLRAQVLGGGEEVNVTAIPASGPRWYEAPNWPVFFKPLGASRAAGYIWTPNFSAYPGVPGIVAVIAINPLADLPKAGEVLYRVGDLIVLADPKAIGSYDWLSYEGEGEFLAWTGGGYNLTNGYGGGDTGIMGNEQGENGYSRLALFPVADWTDFTVTFTASLSASSNIYIDRWPRYRPLDGLESNFGAPYVAEDTKHVTGAGTPGPGWAQLVVSDGDLTSDEGLVGYVT